MGCNAKLKNDDLIDAIMANPDGTLTDIGSYLGVTATTVSTRTKKLLDSNELSGNELDVVKSFLDNRSGNAIRKPKVNMSDFEDAYDEVISGSLSIREACELLEISDSTFYNMRKKLKDGECGKAQKKSSNDDAHCDDDNDQSCKYNISVEEEVTENITSTTSEEKEDKPAEKKPGYIVLFSSAEKVCSSDKYITLKKSYSGVADFGKRVSELEKMIFSNHSDEVIRVTYHKDDDIQDLIALVHVCSGADVPLHITFSGGMYNGKEISMDEDSETRELMRMFPNTDSLESYDFETLEDIRHCRYFYSIITETYGNDGKILKRDREIMADKRKAEELFIQYATRILSDHNKYCIKMYQSNADGQTVSDNETSLRIMSNFRV